MGSGGGGPDESRVGGRQWEAWPGAGYMTATFARADSFVHQLQRDLERCAVHAAHAAIIGELAA
jgi:hypothetical protein